MKAVVQLEIWEWVSGWLMVFTVCITLMHNGFFSEKQGPDSKPRLFVVCIYAACFFFHIIILSSLCLRALSRFCAGGAWGLLNRAHFAVVEYKPLFKHIENSDEPLDFIEIEKSSAGSTFQPMDYDAALVGRRPPAKISRTEAETKMLVAAQKQISHDQEKLRSAMNTAAEKSLDGVLINVVTMLGICVTQAFSAWTTRPLLDNSSTQIGSIALVASAMIGLASMFSSALQLSTASKAFDQHLSLKEIKINHYTLDHVRHHSSSDKAVGFRHGNLMACHITPTALFHTSSWVTMPLAVLFGPSFLLLPSANENERCSSEIPLGLCINVSDYKMVFATNPTRLDQCIPHDYPGITQYPTTNTSIKTRITYLSTAILFIIANKLNIATKRLAQHNEVAVFVGVERKTSVLKMMDYSGKFFAAVAVVTSVADAILQILNIVDVVEQTKKMVDELNGTIKMNYKAFFNGIKEPAKHYYKAVTKKGVSF
ncbi:hypothetical protein FACUT_13965 [Fusarium acutatum]|uniref:Uncharacterized protein n=1 Tax=Fusarium acutatum TaxID=78861 RepID=A0A8H4NA88_9HYPO|nr:hypothetical protein FACUT_13965 [Fusarium acutatum]